MAARSTEERIALIDAKISKKQEEIKTLEAQKQKLLHPVTMRTVMEKAKAAGLSAEEIAEKDVYKRQLFCLSRCPLAWPRGSRCAWRADSGRGPFPAGFVGSSYASPVSDYIGIPITSQGLSLIHI